MPKGHLLFNLLLLCSSTLLEGIVIRIYNSTAEVSNNDLVPRGSTVVLVCTETPTPQQVDYQWTCSNPPCDRQYRKVYGNVLVVVATTATRGLYRCRPTPGSGEDARTLYVQGSLVGDQLNIYNSEGLLLPNTLFTSREEMPKELICTRNGYSYVPRFRREGNSTAIGTQTSPSTRVQTVILQPNGRYWCDAGSVKKEFFIYLTNAILPTPQVSVKSTTTDQQLHLLLTPPPPYNSGRFILRYDCTLGGADIEVEYRSLDPGVNSNTVVTRSRSCFLVGEISRATVWFVTGENISTAPAVVDVDGANLTVIPNKATETITSPPPPTTTTTATTASSTTTNRPATSPPPTTMSMYGDNSTANLTVVIDGYTVDSTLTSPATLPLGRTALLVCRVSGIPHGQQTSYQWTCPNQPCVQTGYAGRMINNNIIAINTTSTSDGGTYTCTVTACGGMDGRQDFRINTNGGAVAHSYGRLLVNEAVITDRRQLQPPNDDTGDGRIECTISGGRNRFSFSQYRVDSGNTQKATAVIPREDFRNFTNIEGSCGNVYLYLFLKKNDGFPQARSLTLITASNQSITATVEYTYDSIGIARVITGYRRLDLGHEMVGQFHNNGLTPTVTFSALVPGARYRITVWGLGGSGNKRRGSAPAVLEVTTQPSAPSPPRALTITTDFEDKNELNWLPPRETNGDIQHYTIRYTLQNGAVIEITTTDNTNYYNLTGLEGGQTYYNFTVEAVNLADTSAQNNVIRNYTHNPGSLNTCTLTIKSGQVTTDSSTAIVIGATTANLLILLLSITLLVISGVLIVKSRKRHTSTLHSTSQVTFDKDSKDPAVQIYDEIDDSAKTTTNHTGVYQDLNINNMDASNQYSTMRT